LPRSSDSKQNEDALLGPLCGAVAEFWRFFDGTPLDVFGLVRPSAADATVRRYEILVLLHIAALFVAFAVVFGVTWRANHHSGERDDQSTYERPTPHLKDWPIHHRPLRRV
jgi:hypothetical protein